MRDLGLVATNKNNLKNTLNNSRGIESSNNEKFIKK